ncbi:MAG: hypothetical protein JSS45_12425 [Proteobacteria bacterium]|nr:hypothetical protein [Pseudomonadota bacterium]
MTAVQFLQRRNPASTGHSARDRRQPRPPHRPREFGVGYGTSSGYAPADGRRYVLPDGRGYFRCG